VLSLVVTKIFSYNKWTSSTVKAWSEISGSHAASIMMTAFRDIHRAVSFVLTVAVSMKAIRIFETSVYFYETTCCNTSQKTLYSGSGVRVPKLVYSMRLCKLCSKRRVSADVMWRHLRQGLNKCVTNVSNCCQDAVETVFCFIGSAQVWSSSSVRW
jgi:hypothetical protein